MPQLNLIYYSNVIFWSLLLYFFFYSLFTYFILFFFSRKYKYNALFQKLIIFIVLINSKIIDLILYLYNFCKGIYYSYFMRSNLNLMFENICNIVLSNFKGLILNLVYYMEIYKLNLKFKRQLYLLSFYFLDVPHKGQYFFQDPATPIMEGIINFHHDLLFIQIFIAIFVLYMLLITIFLYSRQGYKSENYITVINQLGGFGNDKFDFSFKNSTHSRVFKAFYFKYLYYSCYYFQSELNREAGISWNHELFYYNLLLDRLVSYYFLAFCNYWLFQLRSYEYLEDRLREEPIFFWILIEKIEDNFYNEVDAYLTKIKVLNYNYREVEFENVKNFSLLGSSNVNEKYFDLGLQGNRLYPGKDGKLMTPPSKIYHNNLLEIIWTVIPSLILIYIAIPSFALLYAMDELVAPVITVKIIGNQWYWRYELSVIKDNHYFFTDYGNFVNFSGKYTSLLSDNTIFIKDEGVISDMSDFKPLEKSKLAKLYEGVNLVIINPQSESDKIIVGEATKTAESTDPFVLYYIDEYGLVKEENDIQYGVNITVENGDSFIADAFVATAEGCDKNIAGGEVILLCRDLYLEELGDLELLSITEEDVDYDINYQISLLIFDNLSKSLEEIKKAGEYSYLRNFILLELNKDELAYEAWSAYLMPDPTYIEAVQPIWDSLLDKILFLPNDGYSMLYLLEYWNFDLKLIGEDFLKFNADLLMNIFILLKKKEFLLLLRNIEGKGGIDVVNDFNFIIDLFYNRFLGRLLFNNDFSDIVNKAGKITFESRLAGIEDPTFHIVPKKLGHYRLLDTDNRLILPEKLSIRLLITATDVLHSWAVPSFGIKLDACPGRLNQTGLFLKRVGTFYGQCSEICGINHAFMPIVVSSVHFEDYENYRLNILYKALYRALKN